MYGHLLEAAHISGYSFARACSELEDLLDEDRWKECGNGFEKIDDFLATIDFSEFKMAIGQRKKITKKIKEIEGATQRAIGGALGVTPMTVGRDINPVTNVTKQEDKSIPDKELDIELVTNVIQTLSGEEVHKLAEKEENKPPRYKQDDEWYTPKWLFDALAIRFSADVCASDDLTYISTPADIFYGPTDDGLSKEWRGTVWCNPPYSTPEVWAIKSVEHGDGLLLTHVPMNAEWCMKVWAACSGIRLFQAIEFVRPGGQLQRPGYWLQLAAFGMPAAAALAQMQVSIDVAANPRRIPSPMWVKDDNGN